jgi:hypothetical protein
MLGIGARELLDEASSFWSQAGVMLQPRHWLEGGGSP